MQPHMPVSLSTRAVSGLWQIGQRVSGGKERRFRWCFRLPITLLPRRSQRTTGATVRRPHRTNTSNYGRAEAGPVGRQTGYADAGYRVRTLRTSPVSSVGFQQSPLLVGLPVLSHGGPPPIIPSSHIRLVERSGGEMGLCSKGYAIHHLG